MGFDIFKEDEAISIWTKSSLKKAQVDRRQIYQQGVGRKKVTPLGNLLYLFVPRLGKYWPVERVVQPQKI